MDFAQWLGQRLRSHDDAALTDYRDQAPQAVRAHPTEEHYLPLLVAYGAAGQAPSVERIVDGYENGALSRDSYLFGAAA